MNGKGPGHKNENYQDDGISESYSEDFGIPYSLEYPDLVSELSRTFGQRITTLIDCGSDTYERDEYGDIIENIFRID